jgi:hypothetical protein
MTRIMYSLLLSLFLAGCAMSMGASEFYETFPATTETVYYTVADALASINAGDLFSFS